MQSAQLSPRLGLINGWPYSGKTRLARRIASGYGALRLNTDEVREMLFAEPYPPEQSEQYARQENLLYSLITLLRDSLLARGASVVLDSAAVNNRLRRYFLLPESYSVLAEEAAQEKVKPRNARRRAKRFPPDPNYLTAQEIKRYVPGLANNTSRTHLTRWSKRRVIPSVFGSVGKEATYFYRKSEIPLIYRMVQLTQAGFELMVAARKALAEQAYGNSIERYLIVLKAQPEILLARATNERGIKQEEAEKRVESWAKKWEQPRVDGARLLEFENNTEEDFERIAAEVGRLFTADFAYSA